ncbi:MAG: hypothetical protein KGJ02_03860, partial [Verrucomicrobiota bacterium]|nr:hypothetical protein [Verrucomicrobiota bacterium]
FANSAAWRSPSLLAPAMRASILRILSAISIDKRGVKITSLRRCKIKFTHSYRKDTELLKVEQTAWYKKEHATFSDMLRAVRMAIWQGNLIPRKAKNTLSGENITPEMEEWAEAIVKRVLQAA